MMLPRPMFTILLLAICTSLGSGLRVQASDLTEIVAEADSAMGRVIVSDGARMSSGSGFVIGRDGNDNPVFLTNDHVASAGSDILVVFRDGTSDLAQFTGHFIASSPDLDMAALVLHPLDAKGFEPSELALSVRELDKGETVSSLGYPGTSDVVVADPDNITFFETTLTQGLVSKVFVSPWPNSDSREEVEIVQHTASINHGNSGGPLLDECGQTVGMNTAGLLDGGGVFLASSSRSIADFLDAAGIAYRSSVTRCGQINEPGFTTDPAAADPVGADPEPVTVTDEASEPLIPGIVREAIWQNILLAVGIALGLAITVALAVLLNRRSGAVDAVVSSPALVLAVRAPIGSHRRVPLTSAQLVRGVILGRGDGADVDVDVAGISRQHARIWIANRKLMLADLGSTNGTTVDGVPLQQGQSHQVNSRSTIVLAGVVTVELGAS